MRLGIMKPVSPYDSATNVLQETFRSSLQLLYDSSIFTACFMTLFLISQSYSRLLQLNGENQL